MLFILRTFSLISNEWNRIIFGIFESPVRLDFAPKLLFDQVCWETWGAFLRIIYPLTLNFGSRGAFSKIGQNRTETNFETLQWWPRLNC